MGTVKVINASTGLCTTIYRGLDNVLPKLWLGEGSAGTRSSQRKIVGVQSRNKRSLGNVERKE
jgi:hypothetical protein